MQEFDTTTTERGDLESDKSARLEALKQYLKIIFKKILVFVSFGPGVLGVLWVLGRLLRR